MSTPEFITALRRHIGGTLLQIPSVAVLVRDAGGRLLLVKDANLGCWNCPGGIIEPLELPADAAVRETWEETRIRISLRRIIGVFGGPTYCTIYANGDEISWVVSVFAARFESGTPEPDQDETTAACFFSPMELDALSLHPHVKDFLHAEALSCHSYFQPSSWRQSSPQLPTGQSEISADPVSCKTTKPKGSGI